MKTVLLLPLLAIALFGAAAPVSAAEFDVDSGRVVMRRLQYCLDCGSALLVTQVPQGVMVRCPDCGREQPRLADQHLLTQLYQLCRLCQGPLNPQGRRPGDVVECGNCHTRQPLTRDVFALGAAAKGLGYVPGFPPGSGKKMRAHSPNLPGAPVTPFPLDDEQPPPLRNDVASRPVPRPPPTPEPPALPKPEPAPSAIAAARPSHTEPVRGEAVDVPAVTADLFGGKRPSRDVASATGAKGASGEIAALVDGAPIYAREVDRIADPVVQRLRQATASGNAADTAAREKALRREVLERLIDRELALREAAALKHRPDPAAVRERETQLAHILPATGVDIRREAERDVIMADMRRRYAEKPGSASPQAVREYYNRNKDSMLQPRLIALDQLVVYDNRSGRADGRPFREIALEISRELEQGRRFDELRERYDEFASTAGIRHEDPPLLPESAYSSQLLAAAGDLRKGGVFGPLFMPGMAVFGKVTDERPEGPVPFEEVEKEIRTRLENEAEEKNLDAWLARLRQKARVEIFE